MHIPVNFRRFSLDDSTQFVRRGDKGVDLVASFCNVYHTSEEDLLNNIQKSNTLIVHNLKKSPCPASLCQAEELKDINTDGFTYFEGLMNEDTLASSIRILEKDHGKAIFETGELDEQILVNDDYLLILSWNLGLIMIDLDENTGAPSLPPRTASTSPATSIGVVVRISCNKSCIVSSTKEKPSDSSGVNKSQLLPLQSACISSQRTNPTGGSEDCAEIIISNFFQKVLSLATIRIKSLCEQLQQPHHVTRKVCDLVQHLLIHRTSLFFNRHIDQLILCSMYAISKVFHLNLTFREIISNFTRQTHCKPRVFRNVFVDWPSTEQYGKARQEAVDIIGFYNGVFIPSAKCTLIKLISDGNPHLKNRYGSLKEDNK